MVFVIFVAFVFARGAWGYRSMGEPVTSRPIPKAPGFFASALRVFDLSVSEMLWSRRTIFMALVVGAPVLIAVFLRLLDALGAPVFRVNGTTMVGPTIFGLMIWVFYLRFTVPVLGVFYGTSLIADEVEDKTITYLFTRPIPRGAVMAGKFLAYLVCTVMVVLPSVMFVYFLIVPLGGGSVASSAASATRRGGLSRKRLWSRLATPSEGMACGTSDCR